jgi:hypothetical protein
MSTPEADKDRWSWSPTVVFGVIGAVVAIAAVGVPWYLADQQAKAEKDRQAKDLIRQQVEQREGEKRAEKVREDEERRTRPYLRLVNNEERPRPTGFTHVTFHNTSPTRNAIISHIELHVSDPKTLRFIEKYHPRVQPSIGGKTDKEEIRLIHGDWNFDLTRFIFFVAPDFYVDPDKPVELRTCIVDPKLPSIEISGELILTLSEGESDTPVKATFRSRQR